MDGQAATSTFEALLFKLTLTARLDTGTESASKSDTIQFREGLKLSTFHPEIIIKLYPQIYS